MTLNEIKATMAERAITAGMDEAEAVRRIEALRAETLLSKLTKADNKAEAKAAKYAELFAKARAEGKSIMAADLAAKQAMSEAETVTINPVSLQFLPDFSDEEILTQIRAMLAEVGGSGAILACYPTDAVSQPGRSSSGKPGFMSGPIVYTTNDGVDCAAKPGWVACGAVQNQRR